MICLPITSNLSYGKFQIVIEICAESFRASETPLRSSPNQLVINKLQSIKLGRAHQFKNKDALYAAILDSIYIRQLILINLIC